MNQNYPWPWKETLLTLAVAALLFFGIDACIMGVAINL